MRRTLTVACVAFCVAHGAASANTVNFDNGFSVELTSDVLLNFTRKKPDARKEIACLALVVYNEARGSPEREKFAVARVTITRSELGTFPDTICENVWFTKNGRRAYSWEPRRPADKRAWREAQRVAFTAYVDRDRLDPTNGATHFCHRKVYFDGGHPWCNSRTAKGAVVMRDHVYMRLAS